MYLKKLGIAFIPSANLIFMLKLAISSVQDSDLYAMSKSGVSGKGSEY